MSKDKNILIVDDDNLVLEIIRNVLTKNGYKPHTCSDAPQALEAIKQDNYDLIITDYMMPVTNGLELSKNIKTHLPNVPILVISGNSFRNRDELTTLNKILGTATEVLGKPFTPKDLITIVDDMLA